MRLTDRLIGGLTNRLYCTFEKYVAVTKVKLMRKFTMLRVGNAYNKPFYNK